MILKSSPRMCLPERVQRSSKAAVRLISDAAWRQEKRSYRLYNIALRRGQLAFSPKNGDGSRSTVRRFLQSLKKSAMLELILHALRHDHPLSILPRSLSDAVAGVDSSGTSRSSRT